MVGELNTYGTETPVLTDYATGVDDPGGTWSVANFTFTAIRTLLQANLTNVTITNATANSASLSSTGYSLTGSDATSMVDLAGTWNTTGTPTAIKLNMTDTASNAASTLLALQKGGNNIFSVGKSGVFLLGDGGGTNDSGIYATIDNHVGFGTTTSVRAIIGGTNSTCGIKIAGTGFLGWDDGGANTVPDNNSPDTTIYREASDHIGMRRTTNAQKLSVYTTWTDASNYERLAITGSAITVETAGTGTDNIDLTLTPAGTGVVKFGTHSAVAAETVTGYITIKDSGGTSRKIAVIS